jgi:hypothetical protein
MWPHAPQSRSTIISLARGDVLSLFRILMCEICAVLAAFLTIPTASAEPNKEQYELRERCGRRAAEFFKYLGYRDASFENHYNPDLNGCFLLVTITRSETGKAVTWVEWQLWDVNENRELDMLGYRPGPQAFVPGTSESACLVGDFTNCRAGERFGAMVRRYMER